MAFKLPKKLKDAISNLPDSEKDKLLFKLLPKEQALCEKLEFELLEQGQTLDDRRTEVKDKIEEVLTGHHYSAGWLMMDLRALAGEITRHTKRTSDQEGEITLTLHMLTRTFEEQGRFLTELTVYNQTLASYVAKKTEFVLNRLAKLHPDLHVEYEDDVNKLLQHIHNSAASRSAAELNLPEVWPA